MKHTFALVAALSLTSVAALAAPDKSAPAKSPPESAAAAASVFTPRAVKSTGTVTVEGHKIAYDAMAGRIVVHPKGWDDATKPKGGNDAIGTADGPPVASMFYVAYFKKGVDRTDPSGHLPLSMAAPAHPPSGCTWAPSARCACVTRNEATPRCALPSRQQRLQPAGRQRSRVHRCAGHGLQPHRRQGRTRRPSRASTRTYMPSPPSSSTS